MQVNAIQDGIVTSGVSAATLGPIFFNDDIFQGYHILKIVKTTLPTRTGYLLFADHAGDDGTTECTVLHHGGFDLVHGRDLVNDVTMSFRDYVDKFVLRRTGLGTATPNIELVSMGGGTHTFRICSYYCQELAAPGGGSGGGGEDDVHITFDLGPSVGVPPAWHGAFVDNGGTGDLTVTPDADDVLIGITTDATDATTGKRMVQNSGFVIYTTGGLTAGHNVYVNITRDGVTLSQLVFASVSPGANFKYLGRVVRSDLFVLNNIFETT